jgi:ribosomal protein L37E
VEKMRTQSRFNVRACGTRALQRESHYCLWCGLY